MRYKALVHKITYRKTKSYKIKNAALPVTAVPQTLFIKARFQVLFKKLSDSSAGQTSSHDWFLIMKQVFDPKQKRRPIYWSRLEEGYFRDRKVSLHHQRFDELSLHVARRRQLVRH